MVPAAQCLQPYLKGLVIDANGDPLDGMTLRWQRWGQSEFYVSGSDPTAPRGEWKFTYYADDPGRATDFVLQIVESEQNPVPLSEPLVLHYAGCGETGQVTNIVFKRR